MSEGRIIGPLGVEINEVVLVVTHPIRQLLAQLHLEVVGCCQRHERLRLTVGELSSNWTFIAIDGVKALLLFDLVVNVAHN